MLAIASGIIAWGGHIVLFDFEDWSGISEVLELAQAICANAWIHRDLLLGGGPTYGDQNRLRLDVAELLSELYLIPYVCNWVTVTAIHLTIRAHIETVVRPLMIHRESTWWSAKGYAQTFFL